MSGHGRSDTKGTLKAEDSFGARGSPDTEVSDIRQSNRSSDRQGVGLTGSDKSPHTEKPRTRDRSSPADSGDDLDEISEDAQSPDGAAEGMRRRYLLRRFWLVPSAVAWRRARRTDAVPVARLPSPTMQVRTRLHHTAEPVRVCGCHRPNGATPAAAVCDTTDHRARRPVEAGARDGELLSSV
jgi:hypothetical protein